MPKAKKAAMKSTKAKTKADAKPKRKPDVKGECLIPPRVPDEVLKHFTYKGTDAEAQEIIDYVEWQSRKDNEHVTFLEKVQTEYVMGNAHDCWNVHTNKAQWWVITGPTNLYSQTLFPSLDYTISFHLGLMRVCSQSVPAPMILVSRIDSRLRSDCGSKRHKRWTNRASLKMYKLLGCVAARRFSHS